MKYNAEIFDQFQFLFKVTGFNDHQLHCVINFRGKIDKNIMKKAMTLLLEVVPILGSAYVTNNGHPYWEKVDASKYEDLIIFTENEAEFNSFITSKLNELVAANEKASNRIVSVEDLTEEELVKMNKYYTKLSELTRKNQNQKTSRSIEDATGQKKRMLTKKVINGSNK